MCVGASLYAGEVRGVSSGGWFVCVDWEPVVSHDVLYDVYLFIVFIFL